MFDPDGNPLTASFADYGFPSAAELPAFTLLDMATPTHLNPLGVKGIGEAGTIGATPAVESAVADAVAHLGVRASCPPTLRVWEAIQAAREERERFREGPHHRQRCLKRTRTSARLLLVHYLRDVLGLTATNVGCDTTSCGACTVLLDGSR